MTSYDRTWNVVSGMMKSIVRVGRCVLAKVFMEISDQVTYGCMPQPSAVLRSAEVALRRDAFRIADEENLFVPEKYLITALGYQLSTGPCVVVLKSEFITNRMLSVPHAHEVYSKDKDDTFGQVAFDVGLQILSLRRRASFTSIPPYCLRHR